MGGRRRRVPVPDILNLLEVALVAGDGGKEIRVHWLLNKLKKPGRGTVHRRGLEGAEGKKREGGRGIKFNVRSDRSSSVELWKRL